MHMKRFHEPRVELSQHCSGAKFKVASADGIVSTEYMKLVSGTFALDVLLTDCYALPLPSTDSPYKIVTDARVRRVSNAKHGHHDLVSRQRVVIRATAS